MGVRTERRDDAARTRTVPRATSNSPKPGDIDGAADGGRSKASRDVLVAAMAMQGAYMVAQRARIIAATPQIFAHKSPQRLPATAAVYAGQMLVGVPPRTYVPIGGKFFGPAYVTANVLGGASAVMSLAIAGPNLLDASKGKGESQLIDSRSGRTGVPSALAGLITVGALVAGARHAPAGSSVWGRIATGFTHKTMSEKKVVVPLIALAAPMVYNELGGFDFLNKGADENADQSFAKAVETLVEMVTHPTRIPILLNHQD